MTVKLLDRPVRWECKHSRSSAIVNRLNNLLEIIESGFKRETLMNLGMLVLTTLLTIEFIVGTVVGAAAVLIAGIALKYQRKTVFPELKVTIKSEIRKGPFIAEHPVFVVRAINDSPLNITLRELAFILPNTPDKKLLFSDQQSEFRIYLSSYQTYEAFVGIGFMKATLKELGYRYDDKVPIKAVFFDDTFRMFKSELFYVEMNWNYPGEIEFDRTFARSRNVYDLPKFDDREPSKGYVFIAINKHN